MRARRLELNLSQVEIGDKLGVSFQQVQKYEKGTNRLGAMRLQQVAEILSVDLAYFVGDMVKGKPKSPSKLTEFIASTDGFKIVEGAMKLSPFHLHAVITLVRSLGGE